MMAAPRSRAARRPAWLNLALPLVAIAATLDPVQRPDRAGRRRRASRPMA